MLSTEIGYARSVNLREHDLLPHRDAQLANTFGAAHIDHMCALMASVGGVDEGFIVRADTPSGLTGPGSIRNGPWRLRNNPRRQCNLRSWRLRSALLPQSPRSPGGS